MEGLSQTRDELGSDIYVFVEGDERHFVAETFAIGVAGWIVSAFLHGFTAAAKGDFEEWGARAWTWLRDGIRSPAQEQTAAPLEAEVSAAAQVTGSRTSGDVEAYAKASDATLRAALEEYGLEWSAAERVAARAREAGLSAIGV